MVINIGEEGGCSSRHESLRTLALDFRSPADFGSLWHVEGDGHGQAPEFYFGYCNPKKKSLYLCYQSIFPASREKCCLDREIESPKL